MACSVFNNDLFTNQHSIEFKKWAEMWNWNYQLINSVDSFHDINKQTHLNTVIEIHPDPMQTNLFFSEWDDACQKI